MRTWTFKIKGPGCYLYEGERAIGQVEGVDRARLMTAAQELLAALLPFGHSMTREEYEQAWAAAQAAITKATGKPHDLRWPVIGGDDNERAYQRVLFSGLDCLPGQQDLFPTDGGANESHRHDQDRST